MDASSDIAVVIPCYKVRRHILSVLDRIGPEVARIYVVDDKCPEETGHYVSDTCTDERVIVIENSVNLGVGGATLVGFQKAIEDGAQIFVKIDGDGQMDPALIQNFAGIIASGEADYAKGNRFFEPYSLDRMPRGRLIGNSALSLISKMSTGYWHSMDPTNGFIAIHTSVARLLPMQRIAPRYFFESDMLFRLNVIGASVTDVPMEAFYGDEVSHLNPRREIWQFGKAHLRNFWKRIAYNYFIRNFSLASIELVLGIILMVFGVVFGLFNWGSNTPATAGTVMMAALPILIGVQLLLAFLNYDIQSVPRTALHLRLRNSKRPMRSLKNGGHKQS